MSLLGKKGGILPNPDPNTRKEKMIKRLLKEAVDQNDWVMVDFVLRKCWNKERIFTITCDQGGSLLHLATGKNFHATVRVLLQHGINVNNRNQNGDTSLHVAAISGFSDILDLLFESGCNPFIENRTGRQAIDCVENDSCIKQKLRLYSVQCSRVKLMKTLETWKNIVEEDERKEELFRNGMTDQTKQKSTSLRAVTVTPPSTLKRSDSTLKRSDSGIISDFDSEKSSSRASISSNISKTANLISLHSHKESCLNIPEEREQRSPEKKNGSKITKSFSFTVKDITTQYNNVTSALRKISSQGKYEFKPSEILSTQKSQKDSGKDSKNANKDSNINSKNSQKDSAKDSKYGQKDAAKDSKNGQKASGGGLRITSIYGEPKKSSKRKKKIDRSQRMSLPIFPMFAPPESYI